MKRLKSRRRVVLWLPAAAVIVAGPLLVWLAVQGRDWRVVVAAVGLAVPVSVALAGLLERELVRRRGDTDAPPTPEGLPAELREQWRGRLLAAVAKERVGDGGQLGKMVRQGATIDVDVDVATVDHDSGRTRLRVGERLLPWSEIKHQWEDSQGRLVILGDPGYGKTVAALTLIKHINAHQGPSASVAELFPLAEWQRWHGQHPHVPFGDWLVEQLTVSYPQIPGQVARELVDARLVLPVLDGLDEIARVAHRRACVDAIDAYTERAEPHRRFVVTCRADEYHELAPDWVQPGEHVVLVGLQPDQIQQKLNDTTGRAGWEAIRARQAAGDSTLNELLTSPLYLALALQVYRDRDPSELLALTVQQARNRLWELLLATHADTYRGAKPADVRAWLAWLAAGMKRNGRQRFMLHELYLLDPQRTKTVRAFRIAMGLVFGLAFGLLGGLLGGLAGGLILGLLGGLAGGLAGVLGSDPASPSVGIQVSWRARIRHAMRRENLADELAGGLMFGLAGGLMFGLTFGLAGGLVGGLAVVLAHRLLGVINDLAAAGTAVVGADPPRRFAHARPDAVLTASRRSGLVGGLLGGLAGGLIFGLLGGLAGGLAGGPAGGLAVGPIAGLAFGLRGGLDAWLYHYFLRGRLRARGVLPVRLPEFLEWCADDERGWLRITDAYEFRHREFLDHLALTTGGVQQAAILQDGVMVPSAP